MGISPRIASFDHFKVHVDTILIYQADLSIICLRAGPGDFNSLSEDELLQLPGRFLTIGLSRLHQTATLAYFRSLRGISGGI